MSRRASRLISSQTSNWISTRTEPCRDLFWAMAGDGVDVGAGTGTGVDTMRVEFAISIRSAFWFGSLNCGDHGATGDRKPLRCGQLSMSIVPETGRDGE